MDRYFEKNKKTREKQHQGRVRTSQRYPSVTMPKTGYTVVLMQIADNSHKEILFR